MTQILSCLVAALSVALPPGEPGRLTAYSAAFAAAVRGQTPTYADQYDEPLGDPSTGPFFTDPGGQPPGDGYAAPEAYPPSGGWFPRGGVLPGFSPALPGDPFLAGPQRADPTLPPAYGVNGPQPYRFGWTPFAETGLILQQKTTNPEVGSFQVFEFDVGAKYVTAWGSRWIFSHTPEFDVRAWQGPSAIGLPAAVYRFGWDLELATPAGDPFTVQVGFTPSFNSDLNGPATSNAFNWDGRGLLLWRASPQWMLAGGVMYWDRVQDRILPYAGVVWNPTPRWELRLMFPESRLSYYFLNDGCAHHWLYLDAEYHVEAYEVRIQPGDLREKIQLEDYRVMAGIRSDHGTFDKFIEGGWIFGRNTDFLKGTPGFNIGSGFLFRAGIRF